MALDVASRRADLFALWGEPRASIAERIADVRNRVRARRTRPLRHAFQPLSARPILGATEAKAWERAEAILARVQQATAGRITPGVPTRPQSEGAWRLLRFAAQGNVHDERLWMPIAAASGASGSTTCPRGHTAAGRRFPAGLLRPGLLGFHHPRFRSPSRRRRVWAGVDPADPGRRGPAARRRRCVRRLTVSDRASTCYHSGEQPHPLTLVSEISAHG